MILALSGQVAPAPELQQAGRPAPELLRLDQAIVAALREQGLEVSRSQLARAFAAGQVKVAGRVAKPSLKLEGPCSVELELLPPEPLAHARPEPIDLTIVHEDDDLLIVDKPAKMVVHAGPGHDRGTLVNALLHHLGESASARLPVLPGNGPERPGIVHRLDRDTSGLIVIAKHLAAQAALAQQFRVHSIERAYLGIVVGVPAFTTRRIETSHGRDPSERRRFAPDQGERRAVTTMTVTETFGERAALVRFELETGRTHQIRMHARFVGTPIFADPLYGRLASELDRHALHAAELGFEHPRGGWLRFASPLPVELADLVKRLRAAR